MRKVAKINDRRVDQIVNNTDIDAKGLEMLDRLTNRSVKVLEQYTEERDSNSTQSVTIAGS
jgi:hypothetical protein